VSGCPHADVHEDRKIVGEGRRRIRLPAFFDVLHALPRSVVPENYAPAGMHDGEHLYAQCEKGKSPVSKNCRLLSFCYLP